MLPGLYFYKEFLLEIPEEKKGDITKGTGENWEETPHEIPEGTSEGISERTPGGNWEGITKGIL